ncbi:HAMP domain-containing histidine kinase, partial [Enterobacter kobei]|nr:HAMP domain-containing histidine kinase [Enterobacter kobei]
LVLSFNEMTNRLQILEGLRTQLLAGVPHELKTPITSISALVQAVNDDIISDSRKKEFLAMSLKEAKRLQSMVEDLLDFNSFSAGSIRVKLEKINIQAAVKEIIYQWEIVHADALKNVKITYNSMEKPVYANADSVRLQQIIVNLLNNSLHAIKGKA